MTSKRVVYGKHPLTVRVSPELYAEMRRIAAVKNVSVQELIVEWCEERSKYFEDYGKE